MKHRSDEVGSLGQMVRRKGNGRRRTETETNGLGADADKLMGSGCDRMGSDGLASDGME